MGYLENIFTAVYLRRSKDMHEEVSCVFVGVCFLIDGTSDLSTLSVSQAVPSVMKKHVIFAHITLPSDHLLQVRLTAVHHLERFIRFDKAQPLKPEYLKYLRDVVYDFSNQVRLDGVEIVKSLVQVRILLFAAAALALRVFRCFCNQSINLFPWSTFDFHCQRSC